MNYTTAMIQLPLVKEAKGETVRTPEDISRVCSDLRDLAQETFHALTLNAKNHLINRHMITLGLADASLIHSRELFRPAIQDGAGAIILLHNHPSGDVTPSAEDIRITKQMIEAGKIVDIKVLDHIIIGQKHDSQKGFFSMREEGVCDFK